MESALQTQRRPSLDSAASHRPVVLLVGRDRRELDIGVSRFLADHFRRRGWSVEWDDPSWSAVDLLARLHPGIEAWSETARQRLRKWLRRLWYLSHWRDLMLMLEAPKSARNGREEVLRRRVAGLGPGRDLLLVGRSAGALVSTKLGEELGAIGVIALGYPFRAPGMEDDPSRTHHLRTLRVPTLVLQGVDDPYGGSQVASQYPLSKMVTLSWLETDHDFAVGGPCWNTALEALDRFLDALQRGSPRASP